jgi:hypothetical protein
VHVLVDAAVGIAYINSIQQQLALLAIGTYGIDHPLQIARYLTRPGVATKCSEVGWERTATMGQWRS